MACTGQNGRDTVKASGTIEAASVDVAAQLGGRVVRLLTAEGAQVRAGDTLAVLDTLAAGFQARQARASVDLADAQLRTLLNGAREEDRRQAEAQVAQAEANHKNAQADADRVGALFSVGSASRKQKDDIEARLTVAGAQLEAARQARDKLDRFARPEDVDAGRARLEQALAALDLARKNLNECFVVAPVSGTVTSRAVETGDLVAPGGTIAALSELDTVSLVIYVSEKELARVKLGAEAEVKIDAARQRVFPGRITYISPTAEFTPRNIQTREDRVKLVFGVKLRIPNPDGLLKPGLPADAMVKAAPVEQR
jgi:HlyD family secretion protein